MKKVYLKTNCLLWYKLLSIIIFSLAPGVLEASLGTSVNIVISFNIIFLKFTYKKKTVWFLAMGYHDKFCFFFFNICL